MTTPMASAPKQLETKWTPGHWRIERDSDALVIVGRPTWRCTRFGVEGEWDVATIDTGGEDDKANARLIACAPEMAEALQWIVSDSHSLEAAMEKARALLAKIGGDDECTNCDGGGKVWNNADPTSGQWLPCEVCGASS